VTLFWHYVEAGFALLGLIVFFIAVVSRFDPPDNFKRKP
jgi:hypothetical protein